MEIHPILECGDNPSTGLWYVVSSGTAPESRVGQACVAKTNETCGRDEILAIGGANPSATFGEVYRLDWKTLQWSQLESKGLRSRYEHTAFVPSSSPDLVYVFGGANKSGNLDCLQAYDTATSTWSVVSATGKCPGPRTLHCGASAEDKLYIWGGGHLGADPVTDVELHVFDASTNSWMQPTLQGDVPTPRHGHVMVVVGSTLYIHGGMTGMMFHGEMFAIDLVSFSCSKVSARGDVPSARAAHSACTYQSQIYVFGGMCTEGALDDAYSFDTVTLTWTSLKFDCPPPASRLDHSLICTLLPVRKESAAAAALDATKEQTTSVPTNGNHNNGLVNGSSEPNIVPVDIWQGTVTGGANGMQNLSLKDCGDSAVEEAAAANAVVSNLASNDDVASCEEVTYVPVCVVIGGMDTAGNLFNDVLVTAIGNKA